MALASGVTVAVSQAAIFDEAEGAVARISCDEPSDIAQGLSALLLDEPRQHDLRTQAARWTARRAWPLMAMRLLRLLGSRPASTSGKVTPQSGRNYLGLTMSESNRC
jgi:hypothetical protein